jgi:hypothetical protein
LELTERTAIESAIGSPPVAAARVAGFATEELRNSFEGHCAEQRFPVRNHLAIAQLAADAAGIVDKMMGEVVRHAAGFRQL